MSEEKADTKNENLLAVISRVAGKCLLVSQAHVKAATGHDIAENDEIDQIWTESLLAQQEEMTKIVAGRAKVLAKLEELQYKGEVPAGILAQLLELTQHMDAMIAIASNPQGTFAEYFESLQTTVAGYVEAFKAMKELET